jgi:hypothetical protein
MSVKLAPKRHPYGGTIVRAVEVLKTVGPGLLTNCVVVVTRVVAVVVRMVRVEVYLVTRTIDLRRASSNATPSDTAYVVVLARLARGVRTYASQNSTKLWTWIRLTRLPDIGIISGK